MKSQGKISRTFSITETQLKMHEEVAAKLDLNRSTLLQRMISEYYALHCGHEASVELHIVPAEWRVWGSSRTESGQGACTPYHKLGTCTAESCQRIYDEVGIDLDQLEISRRYT
jgi:hypothetical protein